MNNVDILATKLTNNYITIRKKEFKNVIDQLMGEQSCLYHRGIKKGVQTEIPKDYHRYSVLKFLRRRTELSVLSIMYIKSLTYF